MGNMLKQAQKMQADMARVQEELKEERVEASVGGGMVKVVMTGDLAVESGSRRYNRSLLIDPDERTVWDEPQSCSSSHAGSQISTGGGPRHKDHPR